LLVSLAFQDKGSRLYIEGSMELWVSVFWAEGITKKEWHLKLCSNFKGGELRELSCGSFFPFFSWLVVSLFVDSERVFLLSVYGTPWLPFEFHWFSYWEVVGNC
jgi:hypothetical protein